MANIRVSVQLGPKLVPASTPDDPVVVNLVSGGTTIGGGVPQPDGTVLFENTSAGIYHAQATKTAANPVISPDVEVEASKTIMVPVAVTAVVEW